MKNKTIAVLMGGWSDEREVSLVSGNGVIKALKEIGYDAHGIDVQRDLKKFIQEIESIKPDVIFNALHGFGGEDGVIHGVLEMLNIPYTHSGVTSSAIGMDKILSRKIFKEAGIPIPECKLISFNDYKTQPPFHYPFVIKPLTSGSSRGVFVVHNDHDYKESLEKWTYGDQILIEKYINGREIHVAVLDNKALGSVEIKPLDGFYDYEAKYTEGKAQHILPPSLEKELQEKLYHYAELAHKVLNCNGTTRSDFIVNQEDGLPYILEINTQPGLTPLSLVPEIAAHIGISYSQLLEKILDSARCQS